VFFKHTVKNRLLKNQEPIPVHTVYCVADCSVFAPAGLFLNKFNPANELCIFAKLFLPVQIQTE